MTAKKKKFIFLAVVATILVALVIWIAWGNTALELNTYTISSSDLPESFDGFRIAHVSDLHNAEMGKGNEKLLSMLRDADPDMIAITGDLIDSRNTDVKVALQFVREAVKIAPCYYVTGNHEARVNEYGELKAGMEAAGVIVLEDERTEISIESETITLIGVNDPSYQTDYLFGDSETAMDTKLAALRTDDDGFTVLLSHRPELFGTYLDQDIDLVLSGHAHGGQFRLPFVGGLVAPNQGLFPEYDAGIYTEDNTNMLVSRGIGNSILPFRINNRPEVILIELQAKKGGSTMKCPYCDVEMIPGFLNCGNTIWSERKHKISTLPGGKEKYALHLEVPMLLPHHIESYCCPKCKKIIIDASDYENNLD